MRMWSLLPLALLATVCVADKDDSYYQANSGNPNVDIKMYWKDSENVLQDLSKFSALYVEFHSCVWSWMHYGDGSEDGDIEENDYWYMGSVPPMGANVAFSLYGALKGQTFTGCGANTFINSFYTDQGFTDFAKAMYYAGQSGFSGYASDDDSYSSSYSAQCYGGYGVGCDASNGFALHSYSTNECNPTYATEVTNSLSSLNSAMQKAQCVKIYDSSSYSSSSYSSYGSSGSALDLLSYSTACNYMNFWSPDGECPDPYGKISYYISNYNKGIKIKHPDPFKNYNQDMLRARKMVGTGSMFFVASAFVLILGLTSHLWCPRLPKLPTVEVPSWAPDSDFDEKQLTVQCGGPEDQVDLLPTRSWFTFLTPKRPTEVPEDVKSLDDRETVMSDASTAPPGQKKKRKKKKKKRNNSFEVSVTSVDESSQGVLSVTSFVPSPKQGNAPDVPDAMNVDPRKDSEGGLGVTSWVSFGQKETSPEDKPKEPETKPDATANEIEAEKSPTNSSWFGFRAMEDEEPMAKEKVEDSKEALVPDNEAYHEKETSSEEVPAKRSWFSFLPFNGAEEERAAPEEAGTSYMLHQDDAAPTSSPPIVDGYKAMDEKDVIDEKNDGFALLTAVSSLTCDQATVVTTQEDETKPSEVNETQPEPLKIVPEDQVPEPDSSESMEGTKVVENKKENSSVVDDQETTVVNNKHEDTPVALCHEESRVEAVLSDDGSNIHSVTPSELVEALSAQEAAEGAELSPEPEPEPTPDTSAEKKETVLSDVAEPEPAPDTSAEKKDTAVAICHEEAQVETVLSDESNIHSVTPSELENALDGQEEERQVETEQPEEKESVAVEGDQKPSGRHVGQEVSVDSIPAVLSDMKSDDGHDEDEDQPVYTLPAVLSDARSVGTHRTTPEEMAARLLAESRQHAIEAGDEIIPETLSDMLSIGSASQRTTRTSPEELAARIMRETKTAQEDEQGEEEYKDAEQEHKEE